MDHFEYKVEIKRLQLLFQDKLFPHMCIFVLVELWNVEKKIVIFQSTNQMKKQGFLLCPF